MAAITTGTKAVRIKAKADNSEMLPELPLEESGICAGRRGLGDGCASVTMTTDAELPAGLGVATDLPRGAGAEEA